MRASILTFHDGINYGAFFQVYAMYSYLKELGFDAEVIDYKNKGFTRREKLCFFHPIYVRPHIMLKNFIKIRKFKKAQEDMNYTQRLYTVDELQKLNFDNVVIGSDEVWNCASDFIGYDPVYFSKGINAKRKLSYAASCGSVSGPEAFTPEIREAISSLDNIGVRDDNSINLLKQAGFDNLNYVVDPTFLYDFSSRAVMPEEKDYILVYGAFTNTMIDAVKQYSKSEGKKIVSVGYPCKWADVSYDTLDPFQWLGYFLGSDKIVTTMYHGLLFSIHSNKEFCLFSTPYRKNKVGSLLERLGIENRFVEENVDLKKVFAEPLNYQLINSNRDKLVDASKAYLKGSLLSHENNC